jgi:hypothetical protein
MCTSVVNAWRLWTHLGAIFEKWTENLSGPSFVVLDLQDPLGPSSYGAHQTNIDLRVLLMFGAFIRCSLQAEGLHAQVMQGVMLRDFAHGLCMEHRLFIRLESTATPDHRGRPAACTFALYARAELSCSAAFACMRPAELYALGLRQIIAGAPDAWRKLGLYMCFPRGLLELCPGRLAFTISQLIFPCWAPSFACWAFGSEKTWDCAFCCLDCYCFLQQFCRFGS